jgi:hypothetical protein
MNEESSLSSSLVIAGCLLGSIPALLLNLLAFLMAGAGHGWCTPLGPSLAALVGFPALGVLLSIPPSKEKLPWSLGFLLVALGADVFIYLGTVAEGANYFWTALSIASPVVGGWLLLWSGAQIFAIVGCARACLVALNKRPN